MLGKIVNIIKDLENLQVPSIVRWDNGWKKRDLIRTRFDGSNHPIDWRALGLLVGKTA